MNGFGHTRFPLDSDDIVLLLLLYYHYYWGWWGPDSSPPRAANGPRAAYWGTLVYSIATGSPHPTKG